jgi:single-strand DNA-binding protein
MNLNRVFLLGNCTRDIELRYTPKGTPLVETGLAINRVRTDEGQKREETTFVDVTLWGHTAEVASRYLHKGDPIFIEGRLQLDTWDDKQTGQKRSKLRVVAENMQLLGFRDSSPRRREDNRRPAASALAAGSPSGVPHGVPEPDLDPFR